MVASLPAATQVVGRYALYGKIASGGMATVYFGRMVGAAGFTRTVAVKRLHPHLAESTEFVSMMIDEARLVARVQHPNVVQTIDVVAEGNELLIVMEYVAGDSLAHLLRVEAARRRRIPLAIVSSVMIGALHGMHAAHSAKSDHGEPMEIVHRDISPHNLLVGIDGLTRVIDFGVAKAAGRLQTTRAGVVKGKLPYMAPEQLSGQETTRLADIYAAGVVLWEVLTGRRLFKADDDITLFTQVLAGVSDPPSRWVPDLPPILDTIVMRALAKDPAARFATAREMADALVLAIPPALATDVGTWVEDAGREVLDERSSQLSQIESQSSVPAKLISRVATGPQRARATDEHIDSGPPIPMEPLNIPVELGDDDVLKTPPWTRIPKWVIAAVAALVSLIAISLAMRPGSPSSSAPALSATASGSSVPAPSLPVPVVTSVASPPPAPTATAVSADMPTTSTATANAPIAPKTAATTIAAPPPPRVTAPTRPPPAPYSPPRSVPAPRQNKPAGGAVIYSTPD